MDITPKHFIASAVLAAAIGAGPAVLSHQTVEAPAIRKALFAEHNQMVLDGCLGAVRELRNLCSGLGPESDCLKHATALETRCKDKSQRGDWTSR